MNVAADGLGRMAALTLPLPANEATAALVLECQLDSVDDLTGFETGLNLETELRSQLRTGLKNLVH